MFDAISIVGTLYMDVDWGLDVKLALPRKVTKRDLEFDNPHLKRFYNSFLFVLIIMNFTSGDA
jgi:hypothetical protein